MEKMDTRRAIDEAHKELRNLLARKLKIDRRIVGLGQIIQGLKTLGEAPEVDAEMLASPVSGLERNQGFTDAIRHIIKNSSGPLTAMEIRDELESAGYSGQTPKHTLINVYTVIGRLKSNKEIVDVVNSGKHAYTVSPMHLIADALGI